MYQNVLLKSFTDSDGNEIKMIFHLHVLNVLQFKLSFRSFEVILISAAAQGGGADKGTK